MALPEHLALTVVPESQAKSFAFIFGMASGHINPSLPVARMLAAKGHKVHYLCREPLRAAIEDTGAEFHNDVEVEPELFEGREPDLMGAHASLAREHGLHGCIVEDGSKVNPIQTELRLPGVIRWLREIDAGVVMYCPLMSVEAACAARVVGIPSIALLTFAGPGSMRNTFEALCAQGSISPERLREDVLAFQPRKEAIARINATCGKDLVRESDWVGPLGKMDVLRHSAVTLVTTIEGLYDAAPSELADAYSADGVRFDALGPLLDAQGAKRATTHRFTEGEDHSHDDEEAQGANILAAVRRSRAAGRRVVYVSMGTVLTGDSPDLGWNGRAKGPDGVPRGLSGCELCRAAWAGAFDAFGRERSEEGPLVVVSLGPQPDALGDIEAPANALCAATVPQVELLQVGVDVFLTHGGQNSFTESLSTGAPMVVCPGFGDQVANAEKAAALGVGLQVPRPDPDAGGEVAAAAEYRMDVAVAMRRVAAEPGFAAEAMDYAAKLRRAGGVPRAVAWMLAAAAGAAPPVMPGALCADEARQEEAGTAAAGSHGCGVPQTVGGA